MKRSNEASHIFSERTRQSYVAIILIIYKTYTIVIRQAWPFLIYFLVGGSNKKNYLIIALITAAVVGMIYSIINFFRYFFHIKNDELIIEQGIFKRAKTNVPFDRIQTINFEQNLIHRIFNVVKLKVDTAGSVESELEFQAIDLKSAEKLRSLLLSKKKDRRALHDDESEEIDLKQSHQTIMTMSVPELLRAGMVENHLRSAGFVMAGLYWIWQSASDVGMEDVVEGRVSGIRDDTQVIGFFIVAFIVISFLISLVRMVIKNYDLKFFRSDKGFKINAGLFTKRDVSALDHKIQVMSWSDNPLKKAIGIKDLILKQASSKVLSVNKSIKIPGCNLMHIARVTESLYGKKALSGIEFKKIHPAYFYRLAMYALFIGLPLASLGYYYGNYKFFFTIVLLLGIFLLTRFLSMKKKRYGYNNDMLVIHGGAYGDKTTILPVYKVQALSYHASPYQRRKGLQSITLHTASGKVGIPFIPTADAKLIVDELLFKVETDKRKWM